MFDGYDFTDFWNDSDNAKKNYNESIPTDTLITQIEAELGSKLPASYIWLMKQQNGGIPTKNRFPTNESTSWAIDHFAISGIMGIGYEKRYSLCGDFGSKFMIEQWDYPNIGVSICNCPSVGRDMVFLDYRNCGTQGEPSVVHIDQEFDYYITPLADTFEQFIHIKQKTPSSTAISRREMNVPRI